MTFLWADVAIVRTSLELRRSSLSQTCTLRRAGKHGRPAPEPSVWPVSLSPVAGSGECGMSENLKGLVYLLEE